MMTSSRLGVKGKGGGVKAKFIIHDVKQRFPLDGMGERSGAGSHIQANMRQTEDW